MELTVIILAKEDDLKLKKAVESVSFADETIVVKEKSPVSDFSKVRNVSLGKAKGEWVLFVDSDEVVTKELMKEIQPIVSSRAKRGDLSKSLQIASSKTSRNDSFVGYYIKRKDCWGGRWLEYGETGNIKLLRLAKKGAGRWERPVHEVWKINGRVGELKNPLLHYSHESIQGMVEKLDRYSEMEAEWKLGGLEKLGGLGILIEIILFPVGKFIQNYIFRLGFLDGMEGFIHAGMMSGHSFLVRGKVLARVQESTKR